MIFPFTDAYIEDQEIETELPVAVEWAWDFEKLDYKIKNKRMYKVEREEAVKIWIWKIFSTPRYRYLIHTWYYGHELEELIGRGTNAFVKAEVERKCEDAILPTLSSYVNGVKEFDVMLVGSRLIVNFIVDTIYGEVEISV